VDLSSHRRGNAADGYGRRQSDADAAAVVERQLRSDYFCDVDDHDGRDDDPERGAGDSSYR
jgi:hypothetical protein